ncbi:UNVERIFIED_CONTAM: hypothetical protein GTU68_036098 [Idotea baltica]|nr:hypothetical protein [Idotea baltica]
MSKKLAGNLKGLNASEKKKLEKLYNRKILASEIISKDLAKEAYDISKSLNRIVALLIDRKGRLLDIVLGDKKIVYLPDLGRYRLSKARLRGVRLVFTDLSNNSEVKIPNDIYTDLEKLRLDLVCGIKVNQNKLKASFAYNLPNHKTIESVSTELIDDLYKFNFDFNNFILDLESEISRKSIKHQSDSNNAILVGIYPKHNRDYKKSILELENLAKTSDLKIVDTFTQRRDLDPKTLIGQGRLEELVLHALRLGADILVFDNELQPRQWRAITNATELKVIDRSMLILDIFAKRANSSDGKAQVSLAQLKYNLPRLVEKDKGLSRLTGGIGGRGPGETKLEINRRRSRETIKKLEQKIEKLKERRDLQSYKKRENNLFQAALIGYTNAGKSTLFNALTKSKVLVEDKLFATLETSQRKFYFPELEQNIILSDTVGFIRNLPEELKNAFRATLEQLYDANLLLQVVDASDPNFLDHIKSVNEILKEMDLLEKPRILVFNKFDLVKNKEEFNIDLDFNPLMISALDKKSLIGLKKEIISKIKSYENQLELRQSIV